MKSFALASIVAVALLALGACGPAAPGGTQASAAPAEPAKKKEEAPPIIPGEAGETNSALEIMVKNPSTEKLPDDYIHDEKMPGGTLLGRIVIVSDDAAKAALKSSGKKPAGAEVLELTGANAIASPGKGELEYYNNLKLAKERFWGTIVRVKGIKAGRLAPLNPPTLVLQRGLIVSPSQGLRGETSYAFCPLGELQRIGVNDLHPCHFIMKNCQSGKVVMDKEAAAYYDPNRPNAVFKIYMDCSYSAPKVEMSTQSPPLREPGLYSIDCKRHPWQKAYVMAVDSPYITSSQLNKDRDLFEIGGIPPGTWDIEIWNPKFEPADPNMKITITKDERTELVIEMKPREGAEKP